MNFAGINGERAESIRRVLGNTSQRMTAQDIVDAMRGEGSEHLFTRYGHVEKVQAVLRELERRGEVDRTREGFSGGGRLRVMDLWGLK